jgi:hypothetical protein
MPPVLLGEPVAAPIEPLLLSVVIEKFSAKIPSTPLEMLPLAVTVIAPPLLKTGPVTALLIFCVLPLIVSSSLSSRKVHCGSRWAYWLGDDAPFHVSHRRDAAFRPIADPPHPRGIGGRA